MEVEEAYWQILLDWAEGSDSAPADLMEWQQSVIDSSAGVEITSSTFGTLPYRASADGGIGETIVPGLPCLKTVTKYTTELLDTEALLPLADLYRRTFREQLGPPTRFWLRTLNQDAFELLVELYELDRVDSPLSRRRVVLAWMAMADTLASAGYNEMGDRAQEIYLHVSELDPDNQVARYWVAYLDEQYGRYRKAAKQLRRLAEARPDDAEIRLRLAVNLIRTGRKRAASPLLEGIAGGEDPDWIRIVAFQELGRFYAETEVAKAQGFLEWGHRIFPLNARIALQLSHLHPTARHRAIALAYEAEAAWSGDPGVSPRKRYELPRMDGILEARQDFHSEVTSLRPVLGEAMRTLRKEIDLPHFEECDGAQP